MRSAPPRNKVGHPPETASCCWPRMRRFRSAPDHRQEHKNMRYQQNLAGRKIAVVILGRQQWPGLQPYIHLVVEAVNAAQPGSYLEVSLPPVPKRGDPEHGS